MLNADLVPVSREWSRLIESLGGPDPHTWDEDDGGAVEDSRGVGFGRMGSTSEGQGKNNPICDPVCLRFEFEPRRKRFGYKVSSGG